MKFKAHIIEYERGWGIKVDEVRNFNTKEERDAFVKDYNEKYNPPSDNPPEWAMYAVAVIEKV